MTLNEIRLNIADFLNTEITNGGFIFLNLWHIIHLISGVIIMFFILKFFKKGEEKKKFLILIGLVVLYEMFELSFILSGSSFFRGEAAQDVFFDLFLGMIGGFLLFRFSFR